MRFHFKSPDESPGYLLARLTLLWQRKQKRALDPLGLTHTQFVLMATLGWLLREKEEVTQTDIADTSKTDRMMVSKVLRTLEQKKFILRKDHSTDTRAKSIMLSPEGREVLQKAITVVEKTDLEFFSAIEKDLPHFNAQMLDLIQANGE